MFIIRSEEEKAVVEQNHFMSKMKALVCQFSTCVDIKHSTCSYKLKSKMYTFFSHPSEISYKASFCSKIGVFYWVTTILTFIPPLLIAYRSQGKPHFSGRFQIPKKKYQVHFSGFWQKIDSYEEQPDIHFEHDLIVLLETSDPDETIGWSTMSNFNSFLGGNRVRTPMIKSTETDWNRDGVLDYIDFDIEMPLQDHEIIYGVQLHMLFDFKLYVLVFSHTLLFFF